MNNLMNNKVVKIRILDEVNVFIGGLNGEHIDLFYNKYGIYAPNHFFNPKFKLGQWDGMIRFFTRTGRTYLYLLDEIIPQIYKLGYKVDLEDLRTAAVIAPEAITNQIFAHVLHKDTGKPIILRDDQVDAVNALIADGNGICLASTGAGKTFITAALTYVYGLHDLRVITIVPDQTLVKQTKSDYENFNLDVGEYSGGCKNLDAKHVVSTWQALKNNPKVVELFDVVVVDECHGLKGPVLNKILIDHCARIPYRFGVTGTLPKHETDRMSVRVAVGDVKITISAKSLMDEGVLAQLSIDVVQLEENLKKEYDEFCSNGVIGKPPTYTQFKDGYFPDFDAEKSYLQRNQLRIGWVAALIEAKRNQEKGNVLCFVDNITYGRQLAALIPDAIFVNGQDTKKIADRQAIYDMFKTNDHLVVIATVHIAGTGLSIRRIFNLVTIDIGKSFIRVIQAIGRGVRIADDKT